eukprot:1150171-Pelagomonas_calceolata.AAC.4
MKEYTGTKRLNDLGRPFEALTRWEANASKQLQGQPWMTSTRHNVQYHSIGCRKAPCPQSSALHSFALPCFTQHPRRLLGIAIRSPGRVLRQCRPAE